MSTKSDRQLKQQQLAHRLQAMGIMPSTATEEVAHAEPTPQEHVAQRLREMGMMAPAEGALVVHPAPPVPARGLGGLTWVVLVLGLPAIVILLYLSAQSATPHPALLQLAAWVGIEIGRPTAKHKEALILEPAPATPASAVAQHPKAPPATKTTVSAPAATTTTRQTNPYQGQRWLQPNQPYYPPAYFYPAISPYGYRPYPYPPIPYQGRTDS